MSNKAIRGRERIKRNGLTSLRVIIAGFSIHQ